MIKKIVFLVLVSTYLLSNNLKVNEKVNNISFADQFDKTHTINTNTKTIVVSFEKEISNDINKFLDKKAPDFLQKNQAVFIANISKMPSLIASIFALPKMRDYKHSILLIDDEDDKRFMQKTDYSTLYKLENGVIKSISYIKKEDLEKAFKISNF